MTYGKLTGRRRFRVQTRLFGQPLLVLQVEKEIKHYDDIGAFGEVTYVKEWFDARVQDVTAGEAVTTADLEGHPGFG